jgi:hypothetical protein
MYAAIIAAAAAVIGALIAAGQEAAAQDVRNKMAAQYGEEILPDLEKAVAIEAGQGGKSAYEAITPDARATIAQDDVLAELGDIYDTGGMTTADVAAYDQARRGVSQRAASNAGNVSIAAARRGDTDGTLGAILAASGGQSELEALAGLNAEIAKSGRDRALSALTAKGGLATTKRGQSWQEKSGKANAIDLMNRFNASQRQVASMYNLGLPQQQFENEMRLRDAKSAASAGVAAGYDRAAAGTRATAGGLGNAALSYGQAWDWSQDPSKKTSNDDERDY